VDFPALEAPPLFTCRSIPCRIASAPPGAWTVFCAFYGSTYGEKFHQIYLDLAEQEQVALVPFF
jgi:hypothetical protein